MKAVVIDQYGDKSVLKINEKNIPILASDEVLVKIHAASVNPLDWKIRSGELKFFISIKFPYIPGTDFAGVVKDIGSSVTKFKKGDKVYGMLPSKNGGAYAEYVDVKEAHIANMPKNVSFAEAASLPTASIAAHEALTVKGKLKKDVDVLINGASGGVGTIAVQYAKAHGARNVVGVSSSENINFVKELGADRVIDYSKKSFIDEDEIYEIIFDTVGNVSFMGVRGILEPHGTFVTTAGSFSNMALSVATSWWTGRKCRFINVKPSGFILKKITELVESGEIKPVIDKTYTLEEVAKAHDYSETRRARGKIIIKISD